MVSEIGEAVLYQYYGSDRDCPQTRSAFHQAVDELRDINLQVICKEIEATYETEFHALQATEEVFKAHMKILYEHLERTVWRAKGRNL